MAETNRQSNEFARESNSMRRMTASQLTGITAIGITFLIVMLVITWL